MKRSVVFFSGTAVACLLIWFFARGNSKFTRGILMRPVECAYVSNRRDMSDSFAFQNGWPAYYRFRVNQYFSHQSIAASSVKDLRIATVIGERANPLLCRFQLDKHGRALMIRQMSLIQGNFRECFAEFRQHEIYADFLKSYPCDRRDRWPPSKSRQGHLKFYRGKLKWGVDDIDPGTEYFVVVDNTIGVVYLLGW